ncbi:hypothetical protein WJX74_000687 [Apatococcus lobatus]|uniref:J domain-containing protein n=1 Tax=Apatococcus lobatus TaxID=904363 RepID=A0AAW1QDM6_9CHLO
MGSLKWTRENGTSGPIQRQSSLQHHRQSSLNKPKLTWTRPGGSQQVSKPSVSPGSEPLWPSDEPASSAAVPPLQPPLKRQKLVSSGPAFSPTQYQNATAPQAQPSQSGFSASQSAAATEGPFRGFPAKHAHPAANVHSNRSSAVLNGQTNAAAALSNVQSQRTAASQAHTQSNGNTASAGLSVANGTPEIRSDCTSKAGPTASLGMASTDPFHTISGSKQQRSPLHIAAGITAAGTHSGLGTTPSPLMLEDPLKHRHHHHHQQPGHKKPEPIPARGQALKVQEQAAAEEARALAHKAAAAARARQKQKELQALRQKLAVAEQRVAQKQVAADRVAAADQQAQAAQAQEQQARYSRLKAGFSEAFRLAEQAASQAPTVQKQKAAAGPGRPVIDASAIIHHVRAAQDPYVLLQLPPKANTAAVRQKYKELAVVLHPDRCKVPGATEAFQRLVEAYQSILQVERGT